MKKKWREALVVLLVGVGVSLAVVGCGTNKGNGGGKVPFPSIVP